MSYNFNKNRWVREPLTFAMLTERMNNSNNPEILPSRQIESMLCNNVQSFPRKHRSHKHTSTPFELATFLWNRLGKSFHLRFITSIHLISCTQSASYTPHFSLASRTSYCIRAECSQLKFSVCFNIMRHPLATNTSFVPTSVPLLPPARPASTAISSSFDRELRLWHENTRKRLEEKESMAMLKNIKTDSTIQHSYTSNSKRGAFNSNGANANQNCTNFWNSNRKLSQL